MKPLYTIAQTNNVCHGHGDYRNEQQILRTGPYASGPFPPVFLSLESAKLYLEANRSSFSQPSIVELSQQ